jgi:hydroxymethylpyrimidine pyrophosphatase-like HAD family hydrolase
MIRLLVVDVDGVLSLGEAAPFDCTVLQRLAEINDRARHDPTCPAITLCTGRPAPYVEVLMQVIHGFYPAVYEHGAGLYLPEPYGFKWHPSLTPVVQTRLMQFHSVLHDSLVVTGRASFQPGKSASFSLFASPSASLDEVCREAARLAQQFGDTFRVEAGATCVNVLVRGLDKAEGVRWLSRETGIPLQEMAGVGDAPGDMPFMQLLGWAAAPANAHAAVKQMAHYTSAYEDGQGLVDILERFPGFTPSSSHVLP